MPPTLEESCGKEYPHERDAVNKLVLSTKLRIKFRQAVDSGRQSRHGRVVMLHFEKCQQIWGGSPATEQLDGGIESEDLLQPQSEPSVVSLSTQLENEPSGASAQ